MRPKFEYGIRVTARDTILKRMHCIAFLNVGARCSWCLLHGMTGCRFFESTLAAERLSARQLIVQCGLKSQLAYIYIYICAQLPSRLGMQLNLLLRSLYVLLLCLYVPYTCCYYSRNKTLPAPGAPRGASACSRWRPDELHGCRLYTSDARRIIDLDKSITFFLPR